MPDMSRAAVFIDCENVNFRRLRDVMTTASRGAEVMVTRGYGDWAKAAMNNWRSSLLGFGVRMVQQPAYARGKNASDIAIVIDAVDLLHTSNIGRFVLVSSDSDFTGLALRLREAGRHVTGMGSPTAPRALRAACAEYVELHEPDRLAVPDLPVGDEELRTIVATAVSTSASEDGWAPLATVGSYIKSAHPNFDARSYGHAKLGKLVQQQDFLITRVVQDQFGGQVWVRIREGSDVSSTRG